MHSGRECRSSSRACDGGSDPGHQLIGPMLRWLTSGDVPKRSGTHRASYNTSEKSPLVLFHRETPMYGVGDVVQYRLWIKRYRSMPKGAARRDVAQEHSSRFTIAGYSLASRSRHMDFFRRKRLPKGAYLWYQALYSRWWLGRIHLVDLASDNSWLFRCQKDPGLSNNIRSDGHYFSEVQTTRGGSLCLERHDKVDLDEAVLSNADTAGMQKNYYFVSDSV